MQMNVNNHSKRKRKKRTEFPKSDHFIKRMRRRTKETNGSYCLKDPLMLAWCYCFTSFFLCFFVFSRRKSIEDLRVRYLFVSIFIFFLSFLIFNLFVLVLSQRLHNCTRNTPRCILISVHLFCYLTGCAYVSVCMCEIDSGSA